MLVFAKARLVFLSVPKTGTTAYEKALSDHADIIIRSPPLLKHAPLFRYNRFFRQPFEKFIDPGMEILAVMREPVDWLGSWYRYRQRPFLDGRPASTAGMSFDGFVQAYLEKDQPEYANVGSQGKFLEPTGNGTCVTHLFRYDDQDGLQRFLSERLGTGIRTAPYNVSPRADLQLPDRTERRLRSRYARDFTLWEGIGADGRYTPVPRPERDTRQE